MRPLHAAGCAVVLAALAPACEGSAPARDEIVVSIDTDAPVPSWVDRLQVEVFDASGANVVDTRDYALPNPNDWPMSFGVHSASAGDQRLRLRIRAYNSARPISAWQSVVLGQAANGGPDGYDALSTIDRSASLSIRAGSGSRRATIVLRADCFGVPSDVVGGRSCIDSGDVVDLIDELTTPSSQAPASSLVGTWPRVQSVPCTNTPRPESGRFDEELCIPGGTYIMGDRRTEHILPGLGNAEGAPERIVQISPFLLDRYEVSVGRFRSAVLDPVRPFVPPTVPSAQEAVRACDGTNLYRFCTWPGDETNSDNDVMPMNCVTQETARAFCQWAGGDLPTEAQWEYAATAVFRELKTSLPWVGSGPSCDIAVYGRYLSSIGDSECGREVDCGPLRVDVPFGAGARPQDCSGLACVRDETPGPDGRGIVGMGGNVSEWVRDADLPYTDACWLGAARVDPVCDTTGATKHMFRGGSWLLASWMLTATLRSGGLNENPLLSAYGGVGFRCMRPGTSP